MRSPLPRSPTWPTWRSASPERFSVVSRLTDVAVAPHGTPFVVATRSTPSCSLIENWLRTCPGTDPDATYAACAVPVMENWWIEVA